MVQIVVIYLEIESNNFSTYRDQVASRVSLTFAKKNKKTKNKITTPLLFTLYSFHK